MSEAILALLKINLALGAAVLAVMVLRPIARRVFGPVIAYGLWALPPLAAAATLAPARVVTMALPALAAPAGVSVATAGPAGSAALQLLALRPEAGLNLWLILGVQWLAGMLVCLGRLGLRQARFARAERRGLAGPAVVGVLRPRVVTPVDFAERYTPLEQTVVLAHEATHLARQDCRINALVALAACINWFNPLAHLMAHCLRIDQELACDAQVVARHPKARRSYAEAMLKAQLAARPLPMGCYWPAPAAHPLAERVRLLGRSAPGPARRMAGAAAVAVVAFGGAGAAWATRPARVLLVPPAPQAIAAPKAVVGPVFGTTPEPAPVRSAPTVPLAQPAVEVGPEAAALQAEADARPAQSLAGAVENLFPVDHNRRIRAAAFRSSVSPGQAVRLLATMTDPDGVALTTDLTAFGSQSLYRTGYFWRGDSRYALFTAVAQRGDDLVVTASLDRRFAPATSGSIVLRSGQTGRIVLGNGQAVTVTPTVRPETAEEAEAGRRALRGWGFGI